MFNADDRAERQGRMLGELAELDLSAARELHRRLMAAEDDAVAADLARAYQRAARSARQSLALEAKLAREAEQDARASREASERAAAPPLTELTPRNALRCRIETAVERCIWDEAEAEDWADHHLQQLERLLDEDVHADDFLDHPVAAHAARLCADLGLAPPKPRAPFPAERRPAGPSPLAGDGFEREPDG